MLGLQQTYVQEGECRKLSDVNASMQSEESDKACLGSGQVQACCAALASLPANA